ncbi:MAG: hypothetical protein AAGF12_37505 [Myxococcota bacterium]
MRAGIVLMWLLAACGAKTGLRVCEDDASCCEPEPEVCNGLDDDCDGVADDGLRCFFLDGTPIEALETARCGEDWYSYNRPDSESANPTPDIRVSGGLVIAVQDGPTCDGASVALITDLPMDGSGGTLLVDLQVTPSAAGRLLVSDEPNECSYDRSRGIGTCDFTWQGCCTDGFLIGELRSDSCVTLTLSGASGIGRPQVHDGPDRTIPRNFDVPIEICAQIRPAA